MNLRESISKEPFLTVGAVADSVGKDCYVVGGYVRDLLMGITSKDIDFVTVGSGIELAEAMAAREGKKARLTVFRNFGTAHLFWKGQELEFVGARRESYQRNSRKPIVEDGTLEEDLSRRDFTINAMAICINGGERNGELVDLFDGLPDLHEGLIRTPLDPDITFSDDPLRMLRAIRFATKLGFTIVDETLEAITRNAERITIISRERIADELNKIMKSSLPSIGWSLLSYTGLLKFVLPELEALKKVDTVNGRSHKDNFDHTLQVLDKVAMKTRDMDPEDALWIRWGALLHDIAKPVTKRWDEKNGWTFHNHNFIGGKMIPKIFRDLKLPMNEKMKLVQKLVELHMRPIALVEDEVTDSAVRRLLFDAGDDVEALMILCEADITSKNAEKVKRLENNFRLVRKKMVELEERDRIRNFQPPVNGYEIMEIFGMKPNDPPEQLMKVGTLKTKVKDAILDGLIHNDHEQAMEYMLAEAEKLGLIKVKE
ncbi:MAG: HD domain-containing protein [Muribaculaceae bacterium]|nr:HD domain-containing protein [Muribaculaceae bacterium]